MCTDCLWPPDSVYTCTFCKCIYMCGALFLSWECCTERLSPSSSDSAAGAHKMAVKIMDTGRSVNTKSSYSSEY